MWQSWVNVLVGLWSIISGLSIDLITPMNMAVTGSIIAIFGFWNSARWQNVVNGILGVWLLISSFVPGLRTASNMLIVGIVVLILAAWQVLETTSRHPRPTPTHT